MGPLLGSARNSPLVKRKSKTGRSPPSPVSHHSPETPEKESAASVAASAPASASAAPSNSKALKLLGAEDATVGQPPPPSHSPIIPSQDGTRKVSPRPGNKDFLRDLQSYKAASSSNLNRTSGVEDSVSIKRSHSNQVIAASAPQPGGSGLLSSDPDYEMSDTVEQLRERLDSQKLRYEKWKKEHLDDSRLKLSIMVEENRKLQEQVSDLTAQLESTKQSYENVKQHMTRAQQLWEEERAKLNKRYAEDQKKIEKLQKQGKKTKPQGFEKKRKKNCNV